MAVKGNTDFEGHTKGSPFSLTVFPNIACSTTSTATSTALTLCTAGDAATYTIQARDSFFNLRGTHVGDNFVARVRQDTTEALRDHHATVVDNADSTYTLSYVATKSTTNNLWSELANKGSVFAVKTAGGSSSLVESTAYKWPMVANNKIRFRGFFRPTKAGTYTFKVDRASVANVAVSLAVDNKK
jgi:hypothetical protein